MTVIPKGIEWYSVVLKSRPERLSKVHLTKRGYGDSRKSCNLTYRLLLFGCAKRRFNLVPVTKEFFFALPPFFERFEELK
jgi:hypothetical protein